MIKEYFYTGKTTDLAIEKGLAEHALDRDEVSVEIVEMPSKGPFGIGAKEAKVKLSVTVPDEKPAKKPRPENKQKKAPAAKEEKFVTPAQMPGESIKPKKVSASAPAPAPAAPKPKKPEKILSAEQLEKAAATLKKFLEDTLSVMGLDCDIAVSTENNMVTARLTGEGMGLVIGRRGETLDALQQLASLVVNKGKGDYVKVMLDTENYREKREEALQSVARRTAAKVVKSRRNMTLEPMNPYERRIIHSALQGYDHVTTKSVGSEPNRKVVICYVK